MIQLIQRFVHMTMKNEIKSPVKDEEFHDLPLLEGDKEVNEGK